MVLSSECAREPLFTVWCRLSPSKGGDSENETSLILELDILFGSVKIIGCKQPVWYTD